MRPPSTARSTAALNSGSVATTSRRCPANQAASRPDHGLGLGALLAGDPAAAELDRGQQLVQPGEQGLLGAAPCVERRLGHRVHQGADALRGARGVAAADVLEEPPQLARWNDSTFDGLTGTGASASRTGRSSDSAGSPHQAPGSAPRHPRRGQGREAGAGGGPEPAGGCGVATT